MKIRFNYRGYVIEVMPYKPQKENLWATRIIIENSQKGRVEKKEFFSDRKAPSEEEAIQLCLNLGADIIEREYKTGPPPFADIA